MSCTTDGCKQVKAVVEGWMNARLAVQGLWDVFDVQKSLDVVVSVHQSDGARQLPLVGQQTASSLAPDVEKAILCWLDHLSEQPTLKDR